jgi:type IV secretion system protein VirD4
MEGNDLNRFGSARPSTEQEIRRAGYFQKTPESIFMGFAYGKALYGNQDAGFYLQAGSRSGKLTDIVSFSVCQGIYAGTAIIIDPKFELAEISRSQITHRKFCIYWNPSGEKSFPQHRINPVDYLCRDSTALVSDVKLFCQNILPLSGSPQGEFFELRGQTVLEAICLVIVELDGVLTLGRLFEVVNTIPGNGPIWQDFGFSMHESQFSIARSIEEEIAQSRHSDSGTMRSILAEVMKALAPLSDPQLLASVSPPFHMSMRDLGGSQPYHVYLMPPAELVEGWAMVIKALYVAAFIYRRRCGTHAIQQLWLLEECALLKGFPIIPIVFSLGATYGIRAFAIYQTHDQAKATGPNAESILPASAGVSWQFGIRDTPSAERLEKRLDTESLYFDDSLRQREARLARNRAMYDAISGDDPIEAGLNAAHQHYASEHRSVQRRPLQTISEILGMPRNRMWIFADGLEHPIYAERAPYYEQRFMASNFHPSRFHPPLDRVRVKTRFGHKWLRVIEEPVDPDFASFPQYAETGTWSRVEKLRWYE